ncbi:MAG: CoA transferase subunit A [Dehalococcoidia bacterium]|nr:MAG: CoA transferase subunit A [Dehalococcoidia bacterium]
MINKVFDSFDEAIVDIPDGASIAIECWGFPATAHNLIAALKRKGTKDLTVITHTFIPQVFSEELAALPSLLLPQMKKLISPIVGIMRLGAGGFVREYVEKGLEVEVMGHGTLAARLYAGAADLGGIYDHVGVGTIVEEGKEKRIIKGKEYIFQEPIKPDYAFISGHKADRLGNLVYRGNYRSDQPMMAMAARVAIAEVEQIVEVGEIDPEHVVTPGIFIDRIVEIPPTGLGTPEKGRAIIEQLTQLESVRDLLFGKVEQ